MPFVHKDGLLSGGVVVGFEEAADLLLVKVAVVAAPGSLAADPELGPLDKRHLLEVEVDVEVTTASGVVAILGF